MRLLHNARIHTLDVAHPTASTIVIEAGYVLAVGGNELLVECESADCEDMA
jgi:predicted amidohydrolase YtcJ